MQKWEYTIVDSKEVPQQGILKKRKREALEAHLNALGEQGWEFIKIEFTDGAGLSFVGVAKREKQVRFQRRNRFYRVK